VAAAYDVSVPVLHQGQLVGEIAVAKASGETLAPAETAVLHDLAAQAGPALSNVRLTEELRASRLRIVATQDAERRRIERDLHDGAQQHLVALAVNARLARELVRSEPLEAEGLLGDVGLQAEEALRTLRDLARGIYPPALADRGIAAALEAHLAAAASGVHLEADEAARAARFAPEVEAAVYFCCLEAVQNAGKHAPGAPVRVCLSRGEGSLEFRVSDDGPGFEPAHVRGGTGLQGMADRLAAFGGTLDVRSAPGAGATIAGRLPTD
jgi:signal transduction histidine kinase